MNSFIVSAILSGLLALASATSFTDCGSTVGQVISVQVTGCPDGQDVCSLKRGTKVGITINFKATGDSKSLTTVVHGIIASVPLPFPIPKSDGCKSGVTCPIKSGQSSTYTNTLDVRNSYPSVSVTVKWELKDEKKDDMVCVLIDAQIE